MAWLSYCKGLNSGAARRREGEKSRGTRRRREPFWAEGPGAEEGDTQSPPAEAKARHARGERGAAQAARSAQAAAGSVLSIHPRKLARSASLARE